MTATRTSTAVTGPQITSFSVVPQSAINGTTVTCTKASNLFVDFRWTTTGATGVYFGVMTTDAQQAPLPQRPSGQKVSRTITLQEKYVP